MSDTRESQIERMTEFLWGNIVRSENVIGAYGGILVGAGLATHSSGGTYVMSEKTTALVDMYKGIDLLFHKRVRRAAEYTKYESTEYQVHQAFQMMSAAHEEIKNVIRVALTS